MGTTHKRPCARGTILYANEAPPYGESVEHATHTQKHVCIEEPSDFPHFRAKSVKQTTAFSAQSETVEKR